jgi:hypothetical protein
MKNTILRKIDGVAKSIYETEGMEAQLPTDGIENPKKTDGPEASSPVDVVADVGVSPFEGDEKRVDPFYYFPFRSGGFWEKRSLQNDAKEMALSAAVNVANPADPTPPSPPPPPPLPPNPKPDSTETPGMFTRMGKDLDSLSPMTKGILGGAAVGIPIALTGIHLYNKYKRNNQNQYNGYQSQQYQNNYNY